MESERADDSERRRTNEAPKTLPRRTFIKWAGAAGLVGAAVANELQHPDAVAASATPQQVGPVPVDDDPFEIVDIGLVYSGGVSFRAVLRRRGDMVRLGVEGYNLRVDRSSPRDPRLRLIDPTRDAACVITFPPQSVLEETVPDGTATPAPGAVRTRLSRRSRLSFLIPKNTVGPGIPYTTVGLLDWAAWRLNTTAAARAAANDLASPTPVRPAPPGPRETSIEAPWWLQISPNRRGRFIGATTPVVGVASGSGHTELWHARFATGAPDLTIGGTVSEGPSRDRTVRAIWSPDPGFAAALADPSSADTTAPFAASLTQADRASLVRLTSDEVLPESATGRVAIPVETLTLSSLGSTIDLGRSFEPARDIDLVAWRHRSTFGREQYVRVVDRGYLLPFGHQASLVRISERRFEGSGAARVAVLRQLEFLVVNQAVIDHDTAVTIPTAGRQLPFGRIRLRTTVTPSIVRAALPNSGQQVANCFFPVLTGSAADLLFDVTLTDRDGRSIDTQMAMLFVKGAQAEDPGPMAQIRTAWNSYQHPTRRWAPMSGGRVAFAPPLAERPGATTVTTDRIRFDLTALADESIPETVGLRRSWASMAIAEIRIEGIESVSNNTLGATTLTYDPVYRSDGFGPTNAGGMWATLGGPAGLSLRFSRPPGQADRPGPGSDRSGGVITPDLEIRGLSRALGVAAGDPQALRAGTFDPTSFFAGPAAPKLLGGISLVDVIEPVSIPAGGVAPASAMSITSRRADDAIETSMLWTPNLRADPAGIFTPGSFRLDAVARTPLDDSESSPSSRIDGELTDFTISIPSSAVPIVALHVDRLTFSSRDGRPPDVAIDVRGVTFGGDLAYVAELSKYFNFGNGGVDIEVLPDRVAVTIGLALPDIAFGVYVLRNVRLAGGLEIPLSGEPVRIRFELSSRDDPFRLTVLGLGGGGYALVAFGVDGLEALELGFEAGADVSLDLGVASASVSVVLGLVVIVDTGPEGDLPEIVAYYRLNGEVSVSLVSVGITLTLALGYRERTVNGNTTRTLYGRASIEVDFSVPLAPTPTVTITVERSISSDGVGIDNVLGNENDSSTYDDYCDAYGAS